jgi:hypothetical protein
VRVCCTPAICERGVQRLAFALRAASWCGVRGWEGSSGIESTPLHVLPFLSSCTLLVPSRVSPPPLPPPCPRTPRLPAARCPQQACVTTGLLHVLLDCLRRWVARVEAVAAVAGGAAGVAAASAAGAAQEHLPAVLTALGNVGASSGARGVLLDEALPLLLRVLAELGDDARSAGAQRGVGGCGGGGGNE